MWHLFFFCKIRIRLDFLDAAASFFSSNSHVFRFNDVEVCPTIEDISALLGSPDQLLPLAFPIGQLDPVAAMCRYFGFREADIPPVCPDSEHVDLRALIRLYPDGTRDRSRVIVFALVAHFLIRPPVDCPHLVPISVLEVCEAIVGGLNPASVILADIFSGLDSGAPALTMRGSPLLLQVTSLKHSLPSQSLCYSTSPSGSLADLVGGTHWLSSSPRLD